MEYFLYEKFSLILLNDLVQQTLLPSYRKHMADIWGRPQTDLFNFILLVHSRTPD